MAEDVLFQVPTPLGVDVRIISRLWARIAAVKHPNMDGRLGDVVESLRDPDEVRRSLSDGQVVLFYRVDRPGRWVCSVVRRLNGDGFLITGYITSAVKEGEQIWRR